MVRRAGPGVARFDGVVGRGERALRWARTREKWKLTGSDVEAGVARCDRALTGSDVEAGRLGLKPDRVVRANLPLRVCQFGVGLQPGGMGRTNGGR